MPACGVAGDGIGGGMEVLPPRRRGSVVREPSREDLPVRFGDGCPSSTMMPWNGGQRSCPCPTPTVDATPKATKAAVKRFVRLRRMSVT